MKIAFLGSRGIPARYSGFETFYEELAVRLAGRGHDVTVYNRSHFIKDTGKEYRGVRIVSLPCIRTKHLETITHTLLSTLHALFGRYDIVYYCIVGNAPLVWLPRLFGAKTLLNVDGSDWAREKWKGFARWYQRRCERVAVTTPNVVIADAKGVQDRYRELYQAASVFVPYGANIRRDERTDALQKWQLTPNGYILFVGRLVPENGAHLLLDAFGQVSTSKKLVIAGDASYSEEYKRELKSTTDSRVIFTGYAFGDEYAQLSSHAYLYVLPSAIDGTRPALLDQMGFSNCVLVRDSAVNMEVVGNCGASYGGDAETENLAGELTELIGDQSRVAVLRNKASTRIQNFYNWGFITEFYEDLFSRLRKGSDVVSYDQHLKGRQPCHQEDAPEASPRS